MIDDWTEHFYYDPTSPSFIRWNRNAANNKVKKHEVAGRFVPKARNQSKGYYRIAINNKSYACHMVIYEMFFGKIPEGMFIDHIDRNSRNNSIDNLRVVTLRENNVNQNKHKINTSGYTGVHIKDNGRGILYWSATWCDTEGKRCSKNFPIGSLGYDEALRLAIEYRNLQIELLREAGINYSKDHGR